MCDFKHQVTNREPISWGGGSEGVFLADPQNKVATHPRVLEAGVVSHLSSRNVLCPM